MRAKMMVQNVHVSEGTNGAGNRVTVGEMLTMVAVGHSRAYNADGTGDENNTYARFTPSASLAITIQNPDLFGKFSPGDKFYVDFTKA